MTSLAWHSISDLSRQIAGKTLSPVELVAAQLARIERLDPKWHAFIRVLPERAKAQARAAEAEVMAGRHRGPLHGIPVGLKDIIDVAGVATTCHSKIYADHLATSCAVVTAKLESAGAVVMGKMSTHEFAIGGPSFDLPWPPAVNPWGGANFPGGSSSGSGVALATGMLPAALGTGTRWRERVNQRLTADGQIGQTPEALGLDFLGRDFC